MFFIPNDWFVDSSKNVTPIGQGLFGILLAILVGSVIFGGIQRIGKVAASLVPFMVILYGSCALIIIIMHLDQIPKAFLLIITDAFTGQAVTGGILGTGISTGVRRAAFSNEAGMGTEAMAHGAAKTKEPIREGLVAMLGPMIDTILVENENPEQPFGVRGVGEVPICPPLGAITNAIEDAIGVRLNSLPMKPSVILNALLNK